MNSLRRGAFEIDTFLAGISNIHIVPTAGGVVLVDTGYPAPGLARLIVQRIGAKGYGPREVRLILLTHGHVDHAGNAAALRQLTGAPVAVHGKDVAMVRQGWHAVPEGRNWMGRSSAQFLNSMPRLSRFTPFTPDLLLSQGSRLDEYGLEGEIIETPGHSTGSVSLLLANGHMLVGDALVNQRRVGFPLYWENGAQSLASARLIQFYRPRQLHTGHGKRFGLDELGRFLDTFGRVTGEEEGK